MACTPTSFTFQVHNPHHNSKVLELMLHKEVNLLGQLKVSKVDLYKPSHTCLRSNRLLASNCPKFLASEYVEF